MERVLALPHRVLWFLNQIVWFLRKPKYYSELWRFVKWRITSLKDRKRNLRNRQMAEAWCAKISTDTETVFQRITGRQGIPSLEELFPDQMAESRRSAKACPIKMGGAGNLELLYHLAEHTQATRIIETGVAYGWSALALLLSLSKRPGARLISTDLPRPGSQCYKHTGCVVPGSQRRLWRVIDQADREALPLALEDMPTIDLCHYDSDKRYAGRAWAYPKLWEALRPGGVFISDDIGDNFAFRDFCTSVGQEPLVLKMTTGKGTKYVGVVVKPEPSEDRTNQ